MLFSKDGRFWDSILGLDLGFSLWCMGTLRFAFACYVGPRWGIRADGVMYVLMHVPDDVVGIGMGCALM